MEINAVLLKSIDVSKSSDISERVNDVTWKRREFDLKSVALKKNLTWKSGDMAE